MTAEELISKKEVLELTGISYGQFYRWKRKGLIPESWFIRKSTFTGQETFLPRAKVLERIEKIKALKDEHSLEELAEVLAPEVSDRRFPPEEVARMEWISPEVRAFYDELRAPAEGYAFHEILYMSAIERLRASLSDEEITLVCHTLFAHEATIHKGGEFRWRVVVGRKPFARSVARVPHKPTVSFCCLFNGQCVMDPLFEEVVHLDLRPVLEEVKLKLSGLKERDAGLGPAVESGP